MGADGLPADGLRTGAERARGVRAAVADLYPGYFALVMATGIVSIAAHFWSLPAVAWALFGVNLVAYAVLWALTLLRLACHLPRVLADLGDHARGAGFLTVVAATCVLGRQFELLTGDARVSIVLWLAGIVLWAVITYAFILAVSTRGRKPEPAAALNGGWLMLVVATQSVSVLGALVANHLTGWREIVLFLSLAGFLVACLLYVILITLIFQRLVFLPLAPEDVTPSYWINMGALAITTLAGATLILEAPAWPFLGELRPFLTGLTLLFWSAGTWWIPVLVGLGTWRHLVRRVPLAYDPQYWALVFPLGMYSAGTFQLSRATGLGFLAVISRCFVYVGLAAWTLAFAGLVRRLVRRGISPSVS